MSADVGNASQQARGAVVNLLTLVAQAAMPAFHVQLAQLLGQSSYGVYVWANILVDFSSSVTLFGMDLAVARQVALARDAGDDARAAKAVGTALRVVLVTGALLSLVLGLGARAIAHRASMPGVEGPLRVLSLVPVAYHATTILLVATQSRGVMKYDFWTRGLLQPLALLGATTLLVRIGLGVTGAAAGVLLAMGSTTLFALFCFRKVLPLGATLRATVSGPLDLEVLKVGLPMTAIGLLWSLQGRLDNTVLGATAGPEATGAYGACMLYAITIGQMRSVFVPGLNAAMPPLLLSGDRASLGALVRRTQRWVSILAAPLLVLFAVFGRELLVVFGKGFADAAPALALLSLAQLFGAMSIPAQTIVVGAKRGASVAAAVVSLALQALLLGPMCRRYGMVGAAGVSALGMLSAQVVQQAWAYRLYGVHGFSWGLVRVWGAALVAALLGRALLSFLPLAALPRFFVAVPAAAVAYLGTLAALGLAPEERAWVRAVRARLPFGRGGEA